MFVFVWRKTMSRRASCARADDLTGISFCSSLCIAYWSDLFMRNSFIDGDVFLYLDIREFTQRLMSFQMNAFTHT